MPAIERRTSGGGGQHGTLHGALREGCCSPMVCVPCLCVRVFAEPSVWTARAPSLRDWTACSSPRWTARSTSPPSTVPPSSRYVQTSPQGRANTQPQPIAVDPTDACVLPMLMFALSAPYTAATGGRMRGVRAHGCGGRVFHCGHGVLVPACPVQHPRKAQCGAGHAAGKVRTVRAAVS